MKRVRQASAQVVEKRLRQLLPTVDMQTTTERQIRSQLEQELGSIDEHKALIKEVIEDFLQEEGDAEDEDAENDEGGRRGNKSSTSGRTQPSRDGASPSFPLGPKKRVSLNSYKGRMLVDIREYYEKDGQELPGQKGLSLPSEQWHTLVAGLPDLERALDDQDPEFTIAISSDRRAYVSEFKSLWSAHVREMYMADGELKPGKKGITLNPSELKALIKAAPAVSAALPAPAPAPAASAPSRTAPSGTRAVDKSKHGPGAEASEASFVSLGASKRASVSTFNGKTGVDLREYYMKGDESLPGKKGITLSIPDWQKLCSEAAAVTAAVSAGNMDYCLKLSGMRQVTLSEFKRVPYIGVREFYEKDGKMLPGAKGLSMNVEQWKALVDGIPTINAQLPA